MAWAPRSKLPFCQWRSLAKGLRIRRKAVRGRLRSRALSWSSFQARRMQSLTHSRECLGLQICIFPPPPTPPDNEPVELVEGVGVGGVESRTHAKWELVGAQPVTGCCELCPRGAARELGVLFITCWTRAPQEGCGFLKPSVSLMFSGIQRK